jgi:hypothetical protein
MKILVSDQHVDRLFHEPVGIPVFSDQRPLSRSTGRIDWRLGGLLSRMLIEEILGPGPPFLLSRAGAKAFPAVMLFWGGEFKKLSQQGVADWTKRASRTMARAGARSFTLAVWDLFDENSSVLDFAAKVMEGLCQGIGVMERGKVRAVRLAWESETVDVFHQELRRGRHKYSEMETWEIAREKPFTSKKDYVNL